jgi:hypothetical protein
MAGKKFKIQTVGPKTKPRINVPGGAPGASRTASDNPYGSKGGDPRVISPKMRKGMGKK